MELLKIIRKNTWKKEVLFILISVFAGINFQLNWFSLVIDESKGKTLADFISPEWWTHYRMGLRLLLAAVLFPSILYIYRFTVYYFLTRKSQLKEQIHKYTRTELWAFTPLLLTGVGYWGYQINAYLILMLVLIIQLFLIFNFYAQESGISMNTNQIKNHRLYLLFFLSGFAALIYQVVWQRALFMFFGVNIETVTVVVSIFMLGLGLGALLGGYLSKKWPQYLPHMFIACEGFIGIFGFASLFLFEKIYHLTLHATSLNIALIIYGVLLIPTVCMGATLPVLVEYFHHTIKKVGTTVSFLYFINTIGSALASFFTVKVLFVYTGMHFSVIFASVCNLAVAFLGIKFVRNYNKQIVSWHPQEVGEKNRISWSFVGMILLSFITGYIAMSQEILWIRLISFFTGGKAEVFGMLVGSVLVGIALGSLVASYICKKYDLMGIIKILSWVIFSAAVLYFISIPAFSWMATKILSEKTTTYIYIVAGIISLLMGINFPLITQFAVRSGIGVGHQVSYIYFANIVGSTLGPVFTGFVLLDYWTFEQNTLFLSIISLVVAAILWTASIQTFNIRRLYQPLLYVGVMVLFFYYPVLYKNLFEKIQLQQWYWGQSFEHIIQNKHGIISIVDQEEGDDVVFGGGIYDGRMNYLLTFNRNIIDRGYAIAALKPDADSILEIGLSSGSWSKVLTMYRPLKSLDIVEINPGYIQLIKKYPSHADLLDNPKVTIHVDDGRRWLSRTDKKFDFILMNTTYHWRSQINNLVSREFLELCRSRLNPGGVMYYNTTGSEDIVFTAAHVFKYITRYSNFVACSDSPFPANYEQKLAALKNFYYEDQPVYQRDSISIQTMEQIARTAFHENLREKILGQSNRFLITDDNLASEFKTPTKFYEPRKAWWLLLQK
ncbi:MAG: methyltransferase domain-containing protein [Bacteroidales bacterium]|nr:methyltransferase domain-containing protein [Bacteroidales bacterium]